MLQYLRTPVLNALIIMSFLAIPSMADAGKIKDIKQEISQEKSKNKSKKSSKSSSGGSNIFGDLIFGLLIAGLADHWSNDYYLYPFPGKNGDLFVIDHPHKSEIEVGSLKFNKQSSAKGSLAKPSLAAPQVPEETKSLRLNLRTSTGKQTDISWQTYEAYIQTSYVVNFFYKQSQYQENEPQGPDSTLGIRSFGIDVGMINTARFRWYLGFGSFRLESERPSSLLKNRWELYIGALNIMLDYGTAEVEGLPVTMQMYTLGSNFNRIGLGLGYQSLAVGTTKIDGPIFMASAWL